jgi:hypothetical protein
VTNAQDEIFVSGTTNSTNLPGQAGLPNSSSKKDVFVSKFNADRTREWTRVLGGTGNDAGSRIALVPDSDAPGEVYVVGRLEETTTEFGIRVSGTEKKPALNAFGGGTADAFLARLRANGEVRWIYYLGGTGEDEALSVTVDANNKKVYVAGKTTSLDTFPGKTPWSRRGDGADAFVSLVDVSNPDSPFISWTSILGTEDSLPLAEANDAAYSVVIQDNAIFVGGVVGSRISGVPIVEDFHEGADDGFVARLGQGGVIDWFTNVGSDSTDEVRALLALPDGRLAVVGNTNHSSFATSSYSQAGGAIDAFVLRLTSANGRRVAGDGLRLGRSADDSAYAASLDDRGNVFIAGRTKSTGLGLHAFDSDLTGDSDGFVAMVDTALTQAYWVSYVGGVSSSEEWVRDLSIDSRGRLTLGGRSSASDVFSPPPSEGPGGAQDGFLARVQVDVTAPERGKVKAAIVGGRITATWGFFPVPAENFSDPESSIVSYEWAIGTSRGGEEVLGFEAKGSVTSAIHDPSPSPLMPGVSYFVTVRATNGVGLQSTATSEALLLPDPVSPDGGTGGPTDGGPGGSGPEPEPLAPIGWGCGSTGGGGGAGLWGLVLLCLRVSRRARPGARG